DSVNSACNSYLAALKIQQEIDSQLGVAACHGYLAQTMIRVEKFDRGVALAGIAQSILRRIEDRFSQRSVLMILGEGFQGIEENQAAFLALLWAWHISEEIGMPDAAIVGKMVKESAPDLDISPPIPDDMLNDAQEQIEQVIRKANERLTERGEGLYDPLEGA
ncbi:MAG: hypothetical protein HQL54_14600, partial [Magnetococcales bacterium]|nr:hypothetical protein [Magnetococcales bacterium]